MRKSRIIPLGRTPGLQTLRRDSLSPCRAASTTESPVQIVLGRKTYKPFFDESQRITFVDDVAIPHASKADLPSPRGMENMVITEEILRRLRSIQEYRDARIPVLVTGEPGAVKTRTFLLYSWLARQDLFRANGFPEADVSDFLGGDKPIAPGIIRSVPGILPTALRGPGLLLIDEISRYRPGILPSVLNPVLADRRVRRQIGKSEFEDFPWHEEAYVMATRNPRTHLGSNSLPADTLNRFQELEWDLLPEIDEKQIAVVRWKLPERVVTACWQFHDAISRATGPGTAILLSA